MTVSVEKCIAAIGSIAISCLLIFVGETAPAIAITGSLVGFFVGETNGKKIAASS